MTEQVHTPEGEAATDVVLALFRANDLVLAAGHRLAEREGLTAARWQVLGAVALAGRPLTVPQIARRMGLTRQAVQATVNQLHCLPGQAHPPGDLGDGQQIARLIGLT